MPDEQPSRLGRYELREVLGRGAMGVVYKGYDSFLDRVVAIKTYRQDIAAVDEARRRFEREVRTASKLAHPNIVVVHDGGLEGDVPYLAMEFVEGPTLEGELKRRERLPTAEALSMALAIADGLAYAHSRGVVHRDLKPANILLASGGQPKIADFGIAKLLDSDVATKTAAVGTPSYMAPEQIEGRSISPATDVFAFAVLTYEMLTGNRAFSGDSLTSLLNQILNTEPAPPTELDPSLPKALDGAIARALVKDPAERTADVTTFASELRQAFSADPARSVATEHHAEAAEPFTGQPVKRGPSWPIVLALVLAAGGIGGYLLFFRTTDISGPGSGPPVPAPLPTDTPVPRPSAAPTAASTLAPTATVPPRPTATEEPRPTPTELPPTPIPTVAPPTAKPTAAAAKPTSTARPPKVVVPPPAAPAPPASARESGFISVTSQPPGAGVKLDGVSSGKSPVNLGPLPAGPHTVSAELDGFPVQTLTINVKAGGLHSVKFTFGPS